MSEETREDLWGALSELWLDTELQPHDLRHLAGVVRGAGCSREELEQICRYELAPVLGGNLLAAAGVWESFDRAWVIAEARRWKERYEASAIQRLRVRFSSWLAGGVKRLGQDWPALLNEFDRDA